MCLLPRRITVKTFILACCFWLSVPVLPSSFGSNVGIIASRQKRLSVLNVIYRKGNMTDNGGTQVSGRPHYNIGMKSSTGSPVADSALPDLIKFTVAPSQITATIARLRTTTRHHFLFSDENASSSSTPSTSSQDLGRDLSPVDPINYPGGEFVPFYPSLNSRNNGFGRATDPQLSAGVAPKKPVYSAPHTTPAAARSGRIPVKPHKPDVYDLVPSPPSSRSSSILIVPPKNGAPPSPTFQARLNINPERKVTTKARPETTTPGVVIGVGNGVRGAPAYADCHGKIGYFSDMSPECDAFLYCDQFGRSYKFLCPIGTKFNPRMCLCDMHSQCLAGVGPMVSPDDPCPPLF